MSIISEELDYQKKELSYPKYRFHKVLQQSGGQSVTLSSGGGQVSTYDIPNDVYNLSKSMLEFVITPTAGGAGNYNWIPKDTISCISRIQLFTKSSQYLCDIPFVQNYSNSVVKLGEKVPEFLTYDNGSNGTRTTRGLRPNNLKGTDNCVSYLDLGFAVGTTIAYDQATSTLTFAAAGLTDIRDVLEVGDVIVVTTPGLTTSGIFMTILTIPTALTVTTSNPPANRAAILSEFFVIKGTAVASNYDRRYTNTAPSVPNEFQYCEPGNANSQTPVLRYRIPMSHFRDSILACNKDLYFNEILQLRIEWSPVNRIGWLGTSKTNPTTGSAALALDVGVSELSFYLAVETDPRIRKGLMDKVMSGFQMRVPYVFCQKSNLTGTSQSITLRYSRGDGETLLKVITVPYNNTETTHLAYDHNNLSDAKIVNYYTLLNNARLQEFNVDTSVFEDYMLHQEMLKGSILEDSNVYQYNWMHVDDFSGFKPSDSESPFTTKSGLDLSTEQKYDVYFTTPGAATQLNHYLFSVCQKVLTINRSGLTIV